MIECSTVLPPAALFFLRCGSIAAYAAVVWEKSGRYGVNFRLPLSEGELSEQLTRYDAINFRNQPSSQSHSSEDRSSSATIPRQTRDTVGNAALAAHFSAIEASHQQVESSMFVLKTLIAGELRDIGELSAARLRLRQANVIRTQIALEACRHLMNIQPVDTLCKMQRRELDVSQTISEHVQSWSIQALEGDWDGYCRATKKVLECVREVIAAERTFLCPMLRGGSLNHRRA